MYKCIRHARSRDHRYFIPHTLYPSFLILPNDLHNFHIVGRRDVAVLQPDMLGKLQAEVLLAHDVIDASLGVMMFGVVLVLTYSIIE